MWTGEKYIKLLIFLKETRKMRRNNARILSLVLAFALVQGTMPGRLFAEEASLIATETSGLSEEVITEEINTEELLIEESVTEEVSGEEAQEEALAEEETIEDKVADDKMDGGQDLLVERIAGDNRYETSALISQKVFEASEAVVIVSGQDFPDALVSGVYANENDLPLLLAPKNGDLTLVEDEIQRLGAEKALIIGGEAAVGPLTGTVIGESERIFGKNRYETAEKLAEKMDASFKGYAAGSQFPDALSAVPLLSKESMPLFLFGQGQVLEGEGYVFGGSAQIGDDQIGAYARVSGKNRYETSVEIAKRFGDFDTVIIASGEDYPDALSAAPLSKKHQAPILLSLKKGLPAEVLNYLMGKEVNHIIIVGGQGALSSKVEWQLQNIREPEIKYSLLTSTILPGTYQEEVQEAVKLYEEQKRGYSDGMLDYDAFGPFAYFTSTANYYREDRVQFDELGAPKVLYRGSYYYNPVTLSQFALSSYAEYLRGEKDKVEFLKICDLILSLVDPDGALRYEFEWYNGNTGERYPVGWTSSMAQGHALSCFARAYHLTQEPKYLEGGGRVLSYLMLDKEEGGVKTTLADLDPFLSDRIFFEEYVSTPNSYTLNGYIFTLLGLYDWSALTRTYPDQIGFNEARWAFDEGVESLQYVIHLYDVGGFTNYDLGFMNFNVGPRLLPGYHAVHIKLLHSLHSITGIQRLKDFEELWKTYV